MKTYFLFTSFLIISCTNERVQELENKVSHLQKQLIAAEEKIGKFEDQLEVINSKIDNAESAVSNLESEVDDFYFEDWKYNVSDVESETENVRLAIEEISYSARD